MRALAVLAHPSPKSFDAQVFADAMAALRESGHEVRTLDLYGEGFEARLSEPEWRANAEVPANCVEHVPLDGSPDVPGDHHCTGLPLEFHLGGVDRSPSPTWAGQWLFTDEDGVYRTGWCVYHLGQHPLSGTPSHLVDQSFANDPDGREVAYLAWRYRDKIGRAHV